SAMQPNLPRDTIIAIDTGTTALAVTDELQTFQPPALLAPLDFGLVGVLSELSGRLAAAAIPIFVLSTYDSDYILVRDASLTAAVSSAARVSSYMMPGVTGRPCRSVSTTVPDVPSTATACTAPAGRSASAPRHASPTACHHSSGSCSCRSPSRRPASAALPVPCTVPAPSTASARTLCVPRSMPTYSASAVCVTRPPRDRLPG
ncbi:MAG: ACT domain-containing protein, partial [Pseudonocardiaceae bacterium]|nr:ACT domain-containing protein [Pseudonocardiaceae bacterium]